MNLREKAKDQRRRRILDAARRRISRHGIEGLAMRRIAEDAEVSVATLYNLYGSKEQILEALLSESLDHLVATFESLAIDDPLERLRAMPVAAIGEYLGDRAFYRPLLRAFDQLSMTPGKAASSVRAIGIGVAAITEAIRRRLLSAELDPLKFGIHIFVGFVDTSRHWAVGVLPDEYFEARALYALDLALAAIALPPARTRLIDELRRLEARLPAQFAPERQPRSRGG